MEHEEELPGVTFYLARQTQLPPGRPGLVAQAAVELRADITDLDTWNEVLRKLDGLRIYTVERLAEEMVSVAQERAKKKTAALEGEIRTLKEKLASCEQELSFARAELQKSKNLLEAVKRLG